MQSVALVSGCSSGIGEDIALKLANENWRVIAGVRNQSDFDLLNEQHKNITPIFLDVTNEQQIQACHFYFEHQKLTLNVLINNAGVAYGGPIESNTSADWHNVFAVNVFGLVDLTRAMLPLLRQSQGRIINVGSISGLIASPFMGIYAASKFAVEGITDTLRRELHSFNVSVSVIEPGPVKTKIWEKGVGKSMAAIENVDNVIRDAYGEKMTVFKHAIDSAVESAVDVSRTTQALYHAATSPKPKTRYIISNRTFMIKLLKLLPDRLADKLILSIR